MSRNVLLLIGLGFLVASLEARAQTDPLVCNGCVNATDIGAGAVARGRIARGAVTRDELRIRSVTRSKLANGVRDAIDNSIGTIVLQQFEASDGSGVAGTICPAGTLVSSVNCGCSDENGTRNFGVLFSCRVAGNGGVAGCYRESGTVNFLLPAPLATVGLVCASAFQNDGEAIAPVFFWSGSNKLDPSMAMKIDPTGIEFESAVNAARETAAIHDAAMQNRR